MDAQQPEAKPLAHAGRIAAMDVPALNRQFKIACGLLCVIACLSAIGPVYRGTFMAEIDNCEGWIAYHVDSVLSGRPLYPSAERLVTNNYPPLFFYLDAALARVIGNSIYAGRILSYAGLLAISIGVWAVLRRLGVRPLFAFASATAYFATMCRLFDSKVAVNDPQLVAHAVMILGLWCFLREREARRPWFVLSAALMATAGFFKHNLFAVPVAVFLTLWREDRRNAARFALLGTALVAIGFAFCAVGYGGDFAYNLFSPRPYHFLRGVKALEDLHRVVVQFVLWVWFATRVRDGERGRIVNTLCLAALVESFIVRGGDEVDKNAGFDLVIALHLALGVALEHTGELRVAWLRQAGVATVVFAALTIRLLFGEHMDSFNVVYDPAMARWYASAERATAEEAARIREIPGPVYCGSPFLCYLAGKPFAVDAVNLGFRIGTGRMSCDVVDRQLESGALIYVPPINASLRPYGAPPEVALSERRPFGQIKEWLQPVGRSLSPPSTPITCKR